MRVSASENLALIVVLLATASIASAEDIGYSLGLSYVKSYTNANGSSAGSVGLANAQTTRTDGTMLHTINLSGATTYYHKFDIYFRAHGLAADQDVVYVQNNVVTTGAANTGSGKRKYVMNASEVDPSDDGGSTIYTAGRKSAFSLNSFSGTGFVWRVNKGAEGDDYGDYASALQFGENSNFQVGTFTFFSDGVGTLDFQLMPSTGRFKLINENTNGAARSAANESSPTTYQAFGDSIQFVVPEPSSLAMLAGIGLTALLGWWQKQT